MPVSDGACRSDFWCSLDGQSTSHRPHKDKIRSASLPTKIEKGQEILHVMKMLLTIMAAATLWKKDLKNERRSVSGQHLCSPPWRRSTAHHWASCLYFGKNQPLTHSSLGSSLAIAAGILWHIWKHTKWRKVKKVQECWSGCFTKTL